MAYLAYAQDVHSGLLDPAAISEELAIRPPRQSVTDLLARAVAADSGADLMQGLVPTSPQLCPPAEGKIKAGASVADRVATDMIAEGDIIRPGDTDPRVAQMRARLGAVGFSAGLGTSPVYDEALVGLVKLFQESNGLSADGAVGPRTVAVMNRSSRDQLQQVLVNLERERWLNIPRGNRHILVNIAAFVAQVYDDGVPVFETRTVVGSGQHHTPEFSDEMTHMVVNPSWHVPVSIIGKEYLPQLQRNNTAMNQQGIQIFYKGRQIDPTLVDFTQFTAGNFPVTMRQPPGAGNALGKVKFLFPNKFDIYLHDTPSKSLFQKSQRDFSHGCVRVQRPMDLAYLLLSRQSRTIPRACSSGRWTPGRDDVGTWTCRCRCI